VAGRYRALLIGNSSYPADEHNLQTLKGPVKDIAALNRALVDPGSGLFADVDVTLLPEATSARAIRALGRFFGAAARDDVLLVYFSGHGKLDQSGRLHLCMQDTESTDLLSTAVSSARINEFADASHARNVIIVLDCCYAGAFRGADLGNAVAGPGRYVLASCRGTQLANDATVENGTSFFTQHLVDGLVGAATDQDADGYVTFSDLYAYVDRRLRETGKQIPQRRVDGDGDVPLAKRPPPAPAQTNSAMPSAGHAATGTHPGQPKQGQPASGAPPAPAVASDGAAGGARVAAAGGAAPAPDGPRPGRARRNVLVAAAAAAVVITGGVIAILVLAPGGSGASPQASEGPGASPRTFTATGPWRLKIDSSGYGNGCSLTYINTRTGNRHFLAGSLYGVSTFQISDTGTFQWRVNDRRCIVVPLRGTGTVHLPFTIDQSDAGDSGVFMAPASVAVHVTNWYGDSSCKFGLFDPATGDLLDIATATRGQHETVTLDPGGRKQAYLGLNGCAAQVSSGR
jgi:Caspase domain